jgi:hypothetical protein
VIEDGEGPRYIEVAYRDREGHFHRNVCIRLEKLDEWRNAYADAQDLYSSYYRFYTEDPEVGPVFSGLGMDFDCAEKPERARKEAIAIISYLKDHYEIPVEGISIAFSGDKGFHIFVNRRVFQADPDVDLPLIWRKMAEDLIKTLGLKTVDLVVYERRRLWRLLNSKHGSSGLYKIPLTFEELKDKNIDEIKVLATKPRILPLVREHKAVPQVVEWFQRTRDQVKTFIQERFREIKPETLLRLKQEVPCVVERLKRGAKEGQRNQCVWRLATYFKSRRKTLDETLHIMHDFYSRFEPGQAPYTLSELEQTIKWVYDNDQYQTINLCACEFFNDFCDKPNCPLFKPEEQKEAYTEDEEAFVEKILSDEDPLKFINQVVALEHAGDREFIQTAYISALSAKLSETKLNAWAIGSSGKGKSHAFKTATKTVPQDLYEVFTSCTPKSLFYYVKKYGEEALENKLLYIDEIEASQDTLPILRSLTGQTDIEPRHLSVYDADLLDLKIKGKRTIWFTSVEAFGTEQIRNRFLFTNPEEGTATDEETEALQDHLERETEEEKAKRLQAFKLARLMTQKIIENTENVEVALPFGVEWPYRKHRWLKPKFYAIIKVSAKINYRKREKDEHGRIIATEEDFEKARSLWSKFEKVIAFRVSEKALALLDAVPEDREARSTYSDLASELDWSTTTAKKYMRELLREELVSEEKKASEHGGQSPWGFWKGPQPRVEDIKHIPPDQYKAHIHSVEEFHAFKKKFLKNETPKTRDEIVVRNDHPRDAWIFRHVKPGAPCESCGKHPVEYLITRPDGAVLKQCERCFTTLRAEATKIRFVEES